MHRTRHSQATPIHTHIHIHTHTYNTYIPDIENRYNGKKIDPYLRISS